MKFNKRQQAVLILFDYSELWSPMGFETFDEAVEEMEYDEIEALMERESHNLEEEIQAILKEKQQEAQL